MNSIEELKGKTIIQIEGMEWDSDQVLFKCSDGSAYKMYHEQDCCESVRIEDVCGDVQDLIDTEIIDARCDTNSDNPPDKYTDSHTWTFYNFRTNKGSLTLRWLGESNGYYGEEVDFKQLAAQGEG